MFTHHRGKAQKKSPPKKMPLSCEESTHVRDKCEAMKMVEAGLVGFLGAS